MKLGDDIMELRMAQEKDYMQIAEIKWLHCEEDDCELIFVWPSENSVNWYSRNDFKPTKPRITQISRVGKDVIPHSSKEKCP